MQHPRCLPHRWEMGSMMPWITPCQTCWEIDDITVNAINTWWWLFQHKYKRITGGQIARLLTDVCNQKFQITKHTTRQHSKLDKTNVWDKLYHQRYEGTIYVTMNQANDSWLESYTVHVITMHTANAPCIKIIYTELMKNYRKTCNAI